ncbi:efflux RND transporter permease subunit [Candidatus Haliotispira prima]|uniref:Efflux RND transporter permease subunit n=1 Tax=Candidatus Haliotispira prima TaxID=3034016 RepID=A0ABY8MMR1_9SPIO|nr:efflux RND transporter permease subunit [Candidatus Haliotispira prima]
MAILVFIVAQYTVSYRPSVNVDNLSYISEETLQAKEAYLHAFGSPDSNLFYLEGMDFFSLEGLNFLYQLEQDIRAEVPYLKEISSLINLFPPNISLPLSEDSEESEQSREWLVRRALESPVVAEHLVSEDGQKALIVLDFEALPTEAQLRSAGKVFESPHISIGRAMEQIVQRHQGAGEDGSGVKIWSSGAAHIVYQQFSFYVGDLSRVFILLLLVMLLLIFFMLRSWLAFFGTLLSSFVANWLTIGTMSLLGLSVDLTFLMIPVTISVATSIGYSVHFYNHFKHSLQHTSVETALGIAWLRCIRPVTFTALTTMLSFLSLRLVPIAAIQATGYACLLEVLVIYIFTMTIFPLILGFTKFKKKHRAILQYNRWKFSVQLERLNNFSFRFRKIIIISSCLFFLLALFYIFDLQANYKFSEFIGSKNQVVKDLEYLGESDFAPVGTVSIVIHNENGLFPEGDEAAGMKMLQDLEQILSEMTEEDIVKQTFWLGNLIRDAARLKGRKDGIASIRSMAQLNGLMLLSGRLSRFDSNSWLSKDRKSLRVLLEIKAFESLPFVDLTEKYKKRLKNVALKSNEGAHVFFTGFIMDTSQGDLLMTTSFIKSIIVSVLIVFVLLLLIFRRLYVTLVSLIPNIFPIVMIGGIISFLDIDLNSFNFLMFPMVIGLIVDDTIHFFYTVVRRFDSSKNYKASIHVTLAQVGPALVETTVILCSTFAVFAFSKFQGLAYMGLFTVLVILMALLADLILGPICLSMLPMESLKNKPLRRFVFWGPVVGKATAKRPDQNKITG